MNIQKAFRYELKPTKEQESAVAKYAGSCRFVYNKALAPQIENYKAGEKFINYVGLCKLLTGWKKDQDMLWLKESPSQSLQHALKDQETAFKNFFKKLTDFPVFKKRGVRDSFRCPDSKNIKLDEVNGRMFLPKLGWIRYRNSRKIQGKIRNVTVSRKGDKWFVSISTLAEVPNPIHKSKSEVGIDLGVKSIATLSSGEQINPINSFKLYEKLLRKYQRILSRKKKFSNNWSKVRKKITKIHIKIADKRKDFLHKLSTDLSKKHAVLKT